MSPISEKDHLRILSLLTLFPSQSLAEGGEPRVFAAKLNSAQRQEFLGLAASHHVLVRGLSVLQQSAALAGNAQVGEWVAAALETEHARIDNALPLLHSVCSELTRAGCPVTVIKSLDHWPDLGCDLDLFTTADGPALCRIFTTRFKAAILPRSWGDRLARKWNFALPGMPEAVEVHSQRLGQTGEHTQMARRFITRRVFRQLQGFTFPVPAPEERIIIYTLQRMYRHYNLRICDFADAAALLDSQAIDWFELQAAARLGGIWPGVATFLKIVSDYVGEQRGRALELPQEVITAAEFGGEKVFVRDRFFRLPIIPEAARLYAEQMAHTTLNGDLPAAFRLSLLPPLASVAAVAYRITGNDKGIW